MSESDKTESQLEKSPSETEVKESESTQHVIRIKKEQLVKTLIPVVMRQTDYTEEMAEAKLEEHNFDLKKVLYEWMGVPIKKDDKPCETSNQERYRLIRNTLDGKNM